MLSGLSRMLRPLRHKWDMTFAPGGDAALALIADIPYDVVVADMRMPGVDGGRVLAEARRLRPQAMRIILSGQVDDAAYLDSTVAAHQCLGKPCSFELLSRTIHSVVERRKTVDGAADFAALSALTNLPMRPAAHQALRAELSTPQPSVRHIAEIAASDVALACRVLQVSRSGLFLNGRSLPEGVRRAVRVVGVRTVERLAMMPGMVADKDLPAFHRVRAAEGAEWPDATDVGDLALDVTDGARATATPDTRLEHANRIGRYLLALWGISAPTD
jgi:DNA-binding NarL/FixJ family response regulator